MTIIINFIENAYFLQYPFVTASIFYICDLVCYSIPTRIHYTEGYNILQDPYQWIKRRGEWHDADQQFYYKIACNPPSLALNSN